MAVTNALSSTSTTATKSAKASAFSELNSEEFVKIMFAELANQDPLKPNDSNQLMQQMANLRSIQGSMDLEAKLKTLVTENQLSSAGNLMGNLVSGLNDRNQRVQGYVLSISRTADGPILNLDTGDRVSLNNVDEVVNPQVLQHDTPPTSITPPSTAPTTTPAIGSPVVAPPVAGPPSTSGSRTSNPTSAGSAATTPDR